jgi:hypothetical protein
MKSSKAKHLDGGNYYDNILIDIVESHKRLDDLKINCINIKKNRIINFFRFYIDSFLQKFNFMEFFVINGLKKQWFKKFYLYWVGILGGRPITTLEFFLLSQDYRKKIQFSDELNWGSPLKHIENWRNPLQLAQTFMNLKKITLRPIFTKHLWKYINKNSIILEYGCSLAPYYNCYKKYFSHLNCKFTLADIPSFPFHYSKYLYGDDENISFITINEDDFLNPLKGVSGYDMIIITSVFEHLDNPLFIQEYLFDRLNSGGLLVFDYIISDGLGLDTPKGVSMREKCLLNIINKTEILFGTIDISQDVGLCIVKKIIKNNKQ